MFNNINKCSEVIEQDSVSSGMNDFLRLDLTFDSDLLHKDYLKLFNTQWVPHFQSNDYHGSWDVLALYSEGGDERAVFTEQHDPKPTSILMLCDYFESVCKTFEAPVLSARLLNLKAGSKIIEHTDYKASYSDGLMRIHVPVVTDPEVCFMINGKRVDMKPGECWYGDFSLPHSIEHRGVADRVHIVIDLERNEWTDELMKRSGYDFSCENNKLPIEVVRRMIAELESSETPAAAGIVSQLKGQYGI